MSIRTIIGILIVLFVCSCAQRKSNDKLKVEKESYQHPVAKSGLKIEYGPNLGASHVDTLGIKNFYVHITATLTNDSTSPIHIQFALANEYEFPTFCGDSNKYKVFLLPEGLTSDTATIYNNIVNGQHDFLNTPLDKSQHLKKTLRPGEFCVVTIGVLAPMSTNCNAVPRAVFSHDNIGLYSTCDIQINQAISIDHLFEIGVKLEYYKSRKFIAPEDACVVIPFGQISYPEF